MIDEHKHLPMWVVYDHPKDYPQGFIARYWHSLPTARPTTTILTAPTLDELRMKIRATAPWTVALQRHPEDDPKIVEVWL